MLNKKTFYISLAVLMALVFTGGYFTGRHFKQCPEVVKEIFTTDTVEKYVGSSPLYLESKPHNVIIDHNMVKNIHDTINSHDTLYKEYPTFSSIDTLRNDSLFVAITDTGNCNGILTRHSVFGGKIKEKTITNTIIKVVQKPTPLFQLNAGVQCSFSNQWKVQDIGPVIQLSLKQKFSVGYSYMVGTSSHNILLTTKIK
jgi:hypothetical protein